MKIKISPEYECSPIWYTGPGWTENIDIELLSISKVLMDKLKIWDDAFQKTYLSEDPASSGFESAKEYNQWEAEGVRLFNALTSEMREKNDVEFYRYVTEQERSQ